MKADRPSATARLITRGIVFLAGDMELGPVVPPEMAAASRWFLADDARRAAQLERLLTHPWFRRMTWGVERAMVPGMLLHYVLRKRCLEGTVRQGLSGGIEQVVILGAGYDTLALRLAPEYPRVRFFEVDHPATQVVKRRVVTRRDALRENLHLIPADLTGVGADEVLVTAGFDPHRPGVMIAEGLLMYLDEPYLSRVLRLGQLAGPRGIFAFTFMEAHGGAVRFRRQSRLTDIWLKLRGEPFRWGIARDDLPRFLDERALAVEALVTDADLRSRFLARTGLADAALADGDHICVARPTRERDTVGQSGTDRAI